MPDTLSSSFDAIVAGSGPGGAMVARELARAGARVLLLERGGDAPLRGTLGQMAQVAAMPGRGAFLHRDASLLVRALTVGGTSTLNFATAAPPPAALFAAHGIDLAPFLAALRAELPIAPLPDDLVGPLARRIALGAEAAGLPWRKLDKMIRPQTCRAGCWRCVYGCPFGAKWSARDLVDDAVRHGATLLARAQVTRVRVEAGRAAGVEALVDGRMRVFTAPQVVLAAGGIGTPRILRASNLLESDPPFFSDPVVAVMGSVDDLALRDGEAGGAEVPMAAGASFDDEGIALADLTLPKPMYQAFAAQVGRLDRLGAHGRTLAIMVKIRDEVGGRVGARWVDKTLTRQDRARFAHGSKMARTILREAGARRVFQSWHFAAHPGGGVPIGAALDADLGTATPGLSVCDASAIPGPWGLPPTLTLLCLGMRLGARLAVRG
ncbi:FAD-dependent oxidoreductase [Massilia sp. 9096]|uniref:FAD-dependent oxidoreductase n=1 Tax=Massilia sp. 9096 TaxID=1500894 RepID=UPI00055C5A4C|nr:FAD-dependent oxidoreductase [Massilia sp. 9096]